MSNLHCKINLVQNVFYFEDIASTNGSWVRLSEENQESRKFELKEQMVFKIGNSAMYEVVQMYSGLSEEKPKIKVEFNNNLNNFNEIGNNNICCICLDNERDVLLIPCRHIVACLKCVKNLDICPLCRA